MRVRPVLVAIPVGLVLALPAMYFYEYGTLNPFVAPAHVMYQGCEFHPAGKIESLDSATLFEHNAIAYANMPIVRVGATLNGMALYALPLGPGAYPCSAAPMDLYVEVSSGKLELYRRAGGP
jgi:hypothetical protein